MLLLSLPVKEIREIIIHVLLAFIIVPYYLSVQHFII